MATHYLDFEFEYDFDLIGISSHVKEYRLVWAINKMMNWNLTRKNDHSIAQKNGFSEHAVYEFFDGLDKSTYTLIENHSPDGFLLPELPQWDFVLKVEHHHNEMDIEVFRALKKINLVQAITVLTTEKLKSKQNLIFS